jgi:hypothetical protein
MAKLTLADLSSLTNQSSAISTINANSALIETALENTLSRDGTSPNTMSASLDMNSNRILNLPEPVADQEPLRLVDGQPILDDAEAARDEAEAALASFQDIWLGNQTGDPSTDLDASALEGGEIYYNTISKTLRVYGLGIGWVDVAPFDDLTQIAAYVLAAAASAAAALTSENAASDSADAALADKIAAAASAVAAASSASSAQVYAAQAAASAVAAAASAVEAAGHSTTASAAATAAAAAYDSFDDRYLGEKNGTPTLDNDGNALLVGALYYDTGDQALKYYNGTIWITLTNSGLAEIVDDLTPQLGGNLDMNNFDIVGTGNIDITGDVDLIGGISTLNKTPVFRLNSMSIDSIEAQYGADFASGIFAIDAAIQYGLVYYAGGNNQYSVWQEFVKSRSVDGTTYTAVQNNDQMIVFNGYGTDGDQQRLSVTLQALVDGTVANNVMPGRWQLWNNDAAGTQRLNLDIRADRSTTLGGTLTLGSDDAYAVGWNGSLAVPTKNAVYDKIESILDGQTFTGAIGVPDDAYAVGWNGSVEVPTKNALYDKIESILDGETFTGAVVVPDDAYAVGWNGSFEVPTKNAVYDKIESILDGQTFTGDVLVPDDAYAVGWNGSAAVPTKNALYDKIETLQPLDADLTSWAAVTRASGFDTFVTTPSLANLGSLLTDEATGLITFMTTPSSANLRSLVTDETGTGALYFQGGDIGTPSAGVGTNFTGIPLTGLTSDTTTALGIGSINLGHVSDTTIARASAGKISVEGSNVLMESGNAHKFAIVFVIDGGGVAITTGIKGDVRIPWAATITKVSTLIDQSGAIVVDLWKDTYANYPPVDGDSITSSTPPTITASGVKSEDSTLTSWITSIAAGDTIRYNVDSVTSATRCTITLECTRTQ